MPFICPSNFQSRCGHVQNYPSPTSCAHICLPGVPSVHTPIHGSLNSFLRKFTPVVSVNNQLRAGRFSINLNNMAMSVSNISTILLVSKTHYGLN